MECLVEVVKDLGRGAPRPVRFGDTEGFLLRFAPGPAADNIGSDLIKIMQCPNENAIGFTDLIQLIA